MSPEELESTSFRVVGLRIRVNDSVVAVDALKYYREERDRVVQRRRAYSNLGGNQVLDLPETGAFKPRSGVMSAI